MASRLKDELVVNKNNETEELLVFGYSCKLFRDDEKALYIDQGKHLIPWMGDDSLKIDRYDARGMLFDLKQAEAPSGGFDHYFGLTDMEKQVEAMCDEERYRALVTNEEEETMYQEEELKRLHYAITSDQKNTYGQVEYKYDGDANNIETNIDEKITEKSEDPGDDEPFIPSPLLDLPINIIVPETVKHNAIIEKTALFISNQGPQMEILLKMKQAGNPQFNFLSFDNPLHNYYRHLLMAIKGGRYKPDLTEGNNKKSDTENEEDDHYLHPSLASSVSKVELAPLIPSINYKPSAHCAYSMLVNKIKDKKSSELGTPFCKLKKALEMLNDKKSGEENGSLKDRLQFSNSQSVEMPPHDMQLIIDKMASYVAKNGRDFEAVVRMKNDPRFDFLNSAHEYNGYYQLKLKQYDDMEKVQKIDIKTKQQEYATMKIKDDPKSKLTPVCFSIKKPKDSEPVIEKSALPIEESSDEEGKEGKKEPDGREEKDKETKEEIVTIDLAAQEEKEEKNKKILATERLKDKLTAAAREKVAMASKEKQLQLDRKRRAAVFLQKLQPEPTPKGAVVYGPQLPGVEVLDRDAEEESDVASLPDASDDLGNDKVKNSSRNRHKSSRYESQKKHKSSGSGVRHKHREKSRYKNDKQEKAGDEESRTKEIIERISVSSDSTDDEGKSRIFYREKSRRSEDRSGCDVQWKSKTDRNRSFRKEEKRHKHKKHKREDFKDKSCRKHSKKRQRRSRESDENSRNSRSKRSRTNSSGGGGASSCDSSDNPNF